MRKRIEGDSSMATCGNRYLVLCPGGLEDVASREISAALAPTTAQITAIPSDMAVCDPSKTNIGAGKRLITSLRSKEYVLHVVQPILLFLGSDKLFVKLTELSVVCDNIIVLNTFSFN